MSSPEAFIFDLDGVLTDTAEYHYRAWKQLADENNLPFTREDNEQLRGVDRRESLLRLLKGKQVPAAQFDQWMELKNTYYRALLTQMTPADVLPGVSHFLAEVRQRGIKVGLASASKNARDVINNLGLLAMIDALGDGYSVSNPKPAPDLFVWVAGRLNAPPMHCVVFEDAESGVEAALAGGMFAVGLGPQSRVGKAHIVLTDLTGITVDAILEKLPVSAR